MIRWLSIVAVVVTGAALRAGEPVVVALGDSITKGVRAGVKSEETFAARLANELGVKVVNVGVGGDRTDGALARLDTAVLALRPKVVLIMYGTNDSYVDKGKSDSRLTPETYRKNLETIIGRLRAANAEPILMTEPRWGRGAKNGAGEDPNGRLERFVDVCREVARDQKVRLVDHYAHWAAAEAKGTNLAEWTTDLCHPNPRGHRELAGLIAPVLRTSLRP